MVTSFRKALAARNHSQDRALRYTYTFTIRRFVSFPVRGHHGRVVLAWTLDIILA